MQIIEHKLCSELSVAHPWALGNCTCVAATDMKSRLLRETIAAPLHDGSLPNFSHYKHKPASSTIYDPCLIHPPTTAIYYYCW